MFQKASEASMTSCSTELGVPLKKVGMTMFSKFFEWQTREHLLFLQLSPTLYKSS